MSLNPLLLDALQRQAATARCRWLVIGNHVQLQRRIGCDERGAGFWLTLDGGSIAHAPSEEALALALVAAFAVATGRVTREQALQVWAQGL